MENLENSVNPQPENHSQPNTKPSPFANSPYIMAHQAPSVNPVSSAAVPPAFPPKPEKKVKCRSAWKTVISAVLIFGLVVGSCAITAMIVDTRWEAKATDLLSVLTDSYDQKIQDLEEQIRDNSFTGNGNSVSGSPVVGSGLTPGQVYAMNNDSVVLIKTTIQDAGQLGSSTGSGFVLREDGYILTNYHVVENGSTFQVVFNNGISYDARLIGGDDINDIAVLKVDITGLKAVKIGSSNDLIVGDQVVAIGNPLGNLTSTLTVGYVSAKDRDVTTDGTIINMIQTDAAINSGNSGGPLFNMKGEVIGITTAKYSGSTSSGASIEGIGFAIPMDDVKLYIIELIQKGYISRPYMGVIVRDMTEFNGVYVDSVEAGGSAAVAGIRSGDIIISIDGTAVSSIAELTKLLQSFKVGQTATIKVYRMRQILDLQITFGEKPHTTSGSVVAPDNSGVPNQGSYQEWFDYFFGKD